MTLGSTLRFWLFSQLFCLTGKVLPSEFIAMHAHLDALSEPVLADHARLFPDEVEFRQHWGRRQLTRDDARD